MYQRILVAVDGSAIAARALDAALTLAGEQHAQVRVIHVVDVAPAGTVEVYIDFEVYRQSCLAGAQDVLDSALAHARQTAVPVEGALVEVTRENPSAGIVAEAKRWGADLIVMGTHGRSGLLHLLLGSVAEGVVRHLPGPLLLIPAAPPTPQDTPA